MNYRAYGFVCLTCLALITTAPVAAADPDPAAMTTAARDLGRQVDFLQELFGTNDQLSQIGGLFQQTMDFQSALIEFRQAVNAKASAEQLAIAFDTVDRKLNAILGEVKFLESTSRPKLVATSSARRSTCTSRFGGTGACPAEACSARRWPSSRTSRPVEQRQLGVRREQAPPGLKQDVAAVQRPSRPSRPSRRRKERPRGDPGPVHRDGQAWGKSSAHTDARPQEKVLAKSPGRPGGPGVSRRHPRRHQGPPGHGDRRVHRLAAEWNGPVPGIP